MIKIKINAIAEELKVDSEEVLKITNKLGISAKTASSTVSYKDAQIIMQYATNELEYNAEQFCTHNSLLKNRMNLLFKTLQSKDYEISELLVRKIIAIGDIDNNTDAILEDVMYGDYETALEKLSKYLYTKETNTSIINYEDKDLARLKKELKFLESTLQTLIEQKTECLNDIEEFNREYNLRLGDVIREILNLRREILYKKPSNNKN
jgi:hypothetical protein